MTTDSAGSVVSVTVREPEFSADDVALMLAVQRRDAEFYTDDITWAEAFDPANDGAFVAVPRTNYADKARMDAQENDRKNKNLNLNGRVYQVKRAAAARRTSEQIRQMMRG